jgi:hypothetical protein
MPALTALLLRTAIKNSNIIAFRSLILPPRHNGVKTAGLLREKTAQEDVSLAVGCRVFARQVEHAMLSSWTAQLGLAFHLMT